MAITKTIAQQEIELLANIYATTKNNLKDCDVDVEKLTEDEIKLIALSFFDNTLASGYQDDESFGNDIYENTLINEILTTKDAFIDNDDDEDNDE